MGITSCFELYFVLTYVGHSYFANHGSVHKIRIVYEPFWRANEAIRGRIGNGQWADKSQEEAFLKALPGHFFESHAYQRLATVMATEEFVFLVCFFALALIFSEHGTK